MKIKNLILKMAATVVVLLALSNVSTASTVIWHQPKVPKCLK